MEGSASNGARIHGSGAPSNLAGSTSGWARHPYIYGCPAYGLEQWRSVAIGVATSNVRNSLGTGGAHHFKGREVHSMEFLEPKFTFVIWLGFRIDAGISVKTAILEFINAESPGLKAKNFRMTLRRWLEIRQMTPLADILGDSGSVMTLTLFETLERGLGGEPIREAIIGLREEMEFATRMAVENHLQRLPVLVLGPLMLLIFPAIMIVMIGPIILRVLGEVGT